MSSTTSAELPGCTSAGPLVSVPPSLTLSLSPPRLRYDNACKSILEVDVKIAALLEKRRVEDVDILDTIIETQGLLQKTVSSPPRLHPPAAHPPQILEHFGSDSQAKGFGEKPNFKKLESRMASRGSSRAGSGGSVKPSSVLSKLPPSAGSKPNSGAPPKASKTKK
jgi:hypothetical protein